MPITPQELASRLRKARETAGLTQEAAAHHLGLARSSLAQVELGNRTISGLELEALARLYGRGIEEFLADEFHPEESLFAIFRADAAFADADEVTEAVSDCIALARELANLEDLLSIDRAALRAPAHADPALHSKWQGVEQGSRGAAAERRRLNLGERTLGDIEDLLQSQGIRTALLDLPEDVSGFTLMEPSLSFLVVANRRHHPLRIRFSWVHEYAHILFDRNRKGTVSRESDRADFTEVRANAFAAAFLMPELGVREFFARLGKGQPSRDKWSVFDEGEVISAEARAEPGSQAVQLYDVVLLAQHFGVSRLAALYRLKNLGLIPQVKLDELLREEQGGRGKEIERSLRLADDREEKGERRASPKDFRSRFLALAIEAYRRGKISRGKLSELASIVKFSSSELGRVLRAVGLDDQEAESEVLLPEGLG
jgi:Zn-dependent peptidase ImmA (M78 family)/transcriptional regulator with XRE-family HTH domain